MSEKDIISLIRAGNTSSAFEMIYVNFPMIKKMVLSAGGTVDDAKDVFQDSIMVFYRLSIKPDFVLTSSISTFLYSVCKKIWLKKIRDYKSKHVQWDHDETFINDPEDIDDLIEEGEKLKLVENMLVDLGEPCRSLLQMFYFEKASMKEIADNMGYSNEKTAKAQKYKCIERGKKMLSEKIILLKSLLK